MITVIILILVGGLLVALYAIFEKLKNQRFVDSGAVKCEIIPQSGKKRTIYGKLGQNTPAGQAVMAGQRDIKLKIPGKADEDCPIYFANKYSLFDASYPGGKGLWARITSVTIPEVTYFAGDPVPAIFRPDEEGKLRSQIIVSEVLGHMRDERASHIMMTQSKERNAWLEAAKRQINPNYVLMGFASILITNIVAIYFALQAKDSVDKALTGIEHIEKLLGA